jgi:hypothetical protein
VAQLEVARHFPEGFESENTIPYKRCLAYGCAPLAALSLLSGGCGLRNLAYHLLSVFQVGGISQ